MSKSEPRIKLSSDLFVFVFSYLPYSKPGTGQGYFKEFSCSRIFLEESSSVLLNFGDDATGNDHFLLVFTGRSVGMTMPGNDFAIPTIAWPKRMASA